MHGVHGVQEGAAATWEQVCYGSNDFWDDYLLLTMGYMLYDALVLLWRYLSLSRTSQFVHTLPVEHV